MVGRDFLSGQGRAGDCDADPCAGFAATTVQRIAETAGVSLGALQHQFPTKAMVLRHYAVKRARLYRRALSIKGSPEARVDTMLDTMWRLVTDEAEFLATMEIELARRSDLEWEMGIDVNPILGLFLHQHFGCERGNYEDYNALDTTAVAAAYIKPENSWRCIGVITGLIWGSRN